MSNEVKIINGYPVKDVKAIRTYDSVADMKGDRKLKVGQHIKTRGYYAIDDGGSVEYYITNTQSESQYQENLENGLYATLIIDDYVTPEMFGCYGDNIHDDTVNLQKAINTNYPIIANKQYKISDTITILNSFIMDSVSYIHLTEDITDVGVLIGNTTSQQFNKDYKVNVNCHGYSNIGIGVELIKRCDCKFNIRNAGTNGIKMNYSGGSGNNENQFNVHVIGNSNGTTENGVIVNCYDSTFSDIITIDCKNGVLLTGTLHVNSVHSWLSNSTMSQLWDNSSVIKSDGAHDCYVNWLYQDTVKYGIIGTNGFKGQVDFFEFNCINDSSYYTTAEQVHFTGNLGILMYIENFVNDIERYNLLKYTLPTSNVNVFGVINNNGANPYYQSSQYHATFTNADDAPQLGSKYVKYDVTNLPLATNGNLESCVVGKLVIQRFYPDNITNEYNSSKHYWERYRTLGTASFTSWYEYKPVIESN